MAKSYHEGEKYHVYVIRRGWQYWTGTRFDLGECNARCFGLLKDALAVIERRGLKPDPDFDDEVQVVACTLTIGAPEEEIPPLTVAEAREIVDTVLRSKS